jgi:23S rRNA (adenine2503-C2)-methyltransferase
MTEQNKENLFGSTLSELETLVTRHNWPRYRAQQIAEWIYKYHLTDFSQMTNLSGNMRNELSSLYTISCMAPSGVQTSADGTKKYLFTFPKIGSVETAYIPEVKRHTLCVSSQIGCRMGCSFCMTARMGFSGNLSAGEILNQVRSIPERDQLTNIVFMGMGEPLDNLENVLQSLEILTAEWGYGMSSRRITVSTIGLVPAMKQFLEKSRCNLAVSLHSPFEEERKTLIPMAKAHNLDDILSTIKDFPIEKQRRISFEYIVFKDLNHSHHHVKALSRALNGIRCRINLLSFHSIPGSKLQAPEMSEVEKFRKALEQKGIITTIRKSRGQDIQAACGLLSASHQNQ